MREVISLHIGQCGIQMGASKWEQLCLEHGISPDGSIADNFHEDGGFYTFFHQTRNGRCKVRGIHVDMEQNVVKDLLRSEYGSLFIKRDCITSDEDSSNCFARGFFAVGGNALNITMDRIRRHSERCDAFQGFLLQHSFGGGTGSGFTTNLVNSIHDSYSQRTTFSLGVLPSQRLCSSVCESYNCLLALRSMIRKVSVMACVENQRIFEIARNQLRIQSPSFKNLNQILAQLVSGITCSLRFDGDITCSLEDFSTNLVPFPRLHLVIASFSPFVNMKTVEYNQITLQKITQQLFRDNKMVDLTQKVDRYIACTVLYRGEVDTAAAHTISKSIKNKNLAEFVDWCPTGVKIGVNYQSPTVVPGSEMAPSNIAGTMLGNNTSMRHVIERISQNFMKIFHRRAFLHEYINAGLEEEDFQDAIDQADLLMEDYKEAFGKGRKFEDYIIF